MHSTLEAFQAVVEVWTTTPVRSVKIEGGRERGEGGERTGKGGGRRGSEGGRERVGENEGRRGEINMSLLL